MSHPLKNIDEKEERIVSKRGGIGKGGGMKFRNLQLYIEAYENSK